MAPENRLVVCLRVSRCIASMRPEHIAPENNCQSVTRKVLALLQ